MKPSSTIKNYLSLIKFSHTVFAMPFAFIGFFLAIKYEGTKVWSTQHALNKEKIHLFNNVLLQKFLFVVLCMVFARSAAMAFNRWADVKWDAKNPRTAIREIPKGVITAKNALLFVIVNSLLFIVTTFFINQLCFLLSPIALLVVLGYSYTKRFTAWCHLILGVGLSLAPIGAYLAVTGAFALLPVLFSFAVVFWVSGFDIIYALQDEAFDKEQGLNSIPAALGKVKALRVSEFLHVLSMVCVVFAGCYRHFNWLYWMGTSVFVGMLIYQHTIVKPNDLRRVNLAFMTANGIASVIFSIFVIADLLLH